MLGGVSLLGGVGGLVGPIAAAFVLTLIKTILIIRGVDQNWAQVIQGAIIVLVVMIGGLAIRQKGKSADERRAAEPDAPPPGHPAAARATTRRSCSTFVFIALFVATDIVNRAQSGDAFLTPTQVSTTFLYAAVLGLIAAGQTLVMLTGGVDLSVATTATAGAFTVSRFGDARRRPRRSLIALAVGLVIGLVNGIGVAIFRVNPLIMTLGISTITLGLLTVTGAEAVHRARARASSRRSARDGSSPTSRTTCWSGRRSPR